MGKHLLDHCTELHAQALLIELACCNTESSSSGFGLVGCFMGEMSPIKLISLLLKCYLFIRVYSVIKGVYVHIYIVCILRNHLGSRLEPKHVQHSLLMRFRKSWDKTENTTTREELLKIFLRFCVQFVLHCMWSTLSSNARCTSITMAFNWTPGCYAMIYMFMLRHVML